MKRNRIKFAAVCILCITLLSGCGSRKEVRDRAFVQAASVNETSDGVSVAVRIFNDENTYRGSGSSFTEAVQSAELGFGKNFFTGHMEIIISSAKNNRSLLESIIKSNNVPPSCTFLYSSNAEKIIQKADFDKLTGIIKIRSENQKALKKSIWTVLDDFTAKGYSATDYINSKGELSQTELKS